MKKTFTLLLALAIALGASAQTFKLTQGDREISNGESFEVGYTTQAILAIWESATIVSPEGGKFISETSSPSDNFGLLSVCSGGECESPSGKDVVIKKEFTLQPNVPMDLQIHRTSGLIQSATGDLIAKVKIYPADHPDQAFTYSANFVVKPASEVAGIGNLASDSEYVKVLGGKINFSGQGNLEIYSILGVRVKSAHAHGEGSLSIANLSRGVYVYRLGKLSGKFTVR